jgi:transitional endoplasmic reticulum ATPase
VSDEKVKVKVAEKVQPKGADTLQLKVAETLSRDVGRAFARMDPEDLARLGVSAGDILEVEGKRRTYCRAMVSYKPVRGQSRVQLDGITRGNAGVGIDEVVAIRRHPCPPAQEVVIGPLDVQPSARDSRYIGGLLDGIPVSAGDRIRAALFGSRTAGFKVLRTSPPGPVLIARATQLVIGETQVTEGGGAAAPHTLSYEDIGGLKPQIRRIREMIELPLRYPEVFSRLGIDAPRGVLLHGPPGTGKTLIARTIAQETEARFFSISGPEIIHKFYGESEAHLRRVFEEAAKKGPSIIFIDEIDSIAPRRETVVGEVEKRVVAQLLALMDGLNQRQNLIVIGATNIPNALDPALRRPGRFDREIVIPIPDRNGRREILEIHSRGMPLAADVNLDDIAAVSHGFAGADLAALCREAAMSCVRRILPDVDYSKRTIPDELLARLEVRREDFDAALREVDASAVREVFVEVPDVRWNDIGGLEPTKAQLVEAVEWPLKYGPLFEKANVRAAKGILLTGPPGCGKTLLAKAIATESGVNFISVKGAALLSKYVGESERAVREVFHKARQAAPCITFFDEIEALVPKRGSDSGDAHVAERVISQFLTEMDGIEELKDVLVLGATNRPDLMDPAVLRPGRFDAIVDIPLPQESDRVEIFQVHLKARPLAPGVDIPSLAARSDGFSGADIALVCSRAGLAAIRRAIAQGVAQERDPAKGVVVIEAGDLEGALAEVRARAAA